MTKISRRDSIELSGISYSSADCVDLLIEVQRRIFGRKLELPTNRQQWKRKARDLLRTHVDAVDIPVDGDLVVMRDLLAKYPGHVGTYFDLAGEGWVLHTTERTDSVFHRVRDLPTYSIIVEGYFRWKSD